MWKDSVGFYFITIRYVRLYVIQDCVGFLHIALLLVYKTRATFSTNQITTKSNRLLVACVFPRLRQFAWFLNFNFSLPLLPLYYFCIHTRRT